MLPTLLTNLLSAVKTPVATLLPLIITTAPTPPHNPRAQIAAALQAEKLILMTDVPGVLRDKDDVATKFNSLNIRECRQLTEDGIIAGGMIPKVCALAG